MRLLRWAWPGISNLVWALGTVSIADRELFSRVGQLVTTGGGDWSVEGRSVEQLIGFHVWVWLRNRTTSPFASGGM